MRTSLGFVCMLALACGGGGGGSPDGGGTLQVKCGDGICDSSEVGTCAQDCGNPQPAGSCGDGVCQSGEINTCPQDCNGSGSGSGSGTCGNLVCDPGEDQTCPQDCGGGSGSGSGSCGSDCTTIIVGCLSGTCTDINACLTCLGGGGGDDSACDGGAPDGTCSATEQTDPTTCIDDCPCNNDGVCDAGEDAAWCLDCP